jgi:hypothetical protein
MFCNFVRTNITPMNSKHAVAIFVLVATMIAGCAGPLIEGTQIQNTPDTRAILEVLKKYRTVMEARDAEGLLALVSPSFFEDLGDSNPANDYGYKDFKDRILPQSFAAARELHVDFDTQDIVVTGDRAHADIRYRSRAQLELPGGPRWDSHREFDRIEMVREQGAWHIIKGL